MSKLMYLKKSDLADLNKVRNSTIKYYSELGLLPFKQEGKGSARHYPVKEASKRLQTILKMRKQGKSVDEILDVYEPEPALTMNEFMEFYKPKQ